MTQSRVTQVQRRLTLHNCTEFLAGLNNMTATIRAQEFDTSKNSFYADRGLMVHDFELIEVELKDEALEKEIVDAMALEAINRINRVNMEISEAEVEIVKLRGQYEVQEAEIKNEQELENLRSANAIQAEQNTADLRMQQQVIIGPTVSVPGLPHTHHRPSCSHSTTASRLTSAGQTNTQGLEASHISNQLSLEAARVSYLDAVRASRALPAPAVR